MPRYGLNKWLQQRLGRKGDALQMFMAALLATAISGVVAYLAKLPLLIPSLGPTIYLIFELPMSPSASPRNTIIGHFTAIAIGLAALAAFGLLDAPSAIKGGVTLAYIAAASLSLAATEGLLVFWDAAHAPAGATVLIVSLGLLKKPEGLLAIALTILLVTFTGWLLNRLAGVPAPIWGADKRSD